MLLLGQLDTGDTNDEMMMTMMMPMMTTMTHDGQIMKCIGSLACMPNEPKTRRNKQF